LIKGGFSRNIETGERLSKSRQKRDERGLWQRRFWDHLIRDERDFQRHLDYIHWNPVKHGWVQQVKDSPHRVFTNMSAWGFTLKIGVAMLICRTSSLGNIFRRVR
jgi:putative transposase